MTIHEICFHGQGGYDYYTVYNMPIWLRKFTYRQILDHYEKQQQQQDGFLESTKKAKDAKNTAAITAGPTVNQNPKIRYS